jgi:hypothetical protein
MNLFQSGVLLKKKFHIQKRLYEIFNEIIDGINFVLQLLHDMDIQHFL